MGKRWTEADDQALTREWNKRLEAGGRGFDLGAFNSEMGARLSRSWGAIHHRRTILGLVLWSSEFYADRDMKIINTHHQNPDLGWGELTELLIERGVISAPYGLMSADIRLIIGEHLLRVCRSREDCHFKALLPESPEVEIIE